MHSSLTSAPSTSGPFRVRPFRVRPLRFSTALALTGLALLTAPRPVFAQTLTLGSLPGVTPVTSGAATISGAGTVATGTFKFSGGAGTATNTYRGASANTGSTLTLDAGATITAVLSGHDQSVININGGTVNQLQSFQGNATNIFGGSVHYASALGSINGGTGTGLVNLYGGSLTYLATQQGGIVDVFGTGLTETFLGTAGDPTLGPLFSVYALGGTLQDGTALSATYSTTAGSLLFNGKAAVPAVPEASTVASLGLLLSLGLGGLAAAARRKRTDVKTVSAPSAGTGPGRVRPLTRPRSCPPPFYPA